MRHRERGSVMIESAAIFSLLLTILIGLVTFGQYLLAFNFVAYAAREGTRFAQVRPNVTEAEIEAYVRRLAMGVNPSAIRVTATRTPSAVRLEVSVGDLKSTSEARLLQTTVTAAPRPPASPQ
jgi:Flp pilus assembly protein TadG